MRRPNRYGARRFWGTAFWTRDKALRDPEWLGPADAPPRHTREFLGFRLACTRMQGQETAYDLLGPL